MLLLLLDKNLKILQTNNNNCKNIIRILYFTVKKKRLSRKKKHYIKIVKLQYEYLCCIQHNTILIKCSNILNHQTLNRRSP